MGASGRFQLRVDPKVSKSIPGAAINLIAISGVRVVDSSPELRELMESVICDYEGQGANMSGSKEPIMMQVRRMYHALGMDPTKNRPASERLVRRVLQGKALYRINNAVDICNSVSLKYRLPLGLYDGDAIADNALDLRFGRPGETYLSLTNADIHVESKCIVADARGSIGSPSTDSRRTKITAQTRSVVCLVYGPAGVPAAYVREVGKTYVEWCRRFCGGELIQNDLVSMESEMKGV